MAYGDKFILKSRTVIGLILTFVPAASTLIGFDWSDGDQSELGEAAEMVVQAIGAVLVVIGRVKANTTLTFNWRD